MQLKLCNIYLNGVFKTSQWLTQKDIEEHIRRGYTVTSCENILRNVDCYKILAYDKDNDCYETLEENVKEEVLDKTITYYMKLLKQNKLRNSANNEPFDWLEIELPPSKNGANVVIAP